MNDDLFNKGLGIRKSVLGAEFVEKSLAAADGQKKETFSGANLQSVTILARYPRLTSDLAFLRVLCVFTVRGISVSTSWLLLRP